MTKPPPKSARGRKLERQVGELRARLDRVERQPPKVSVSFEAPAARNSLQTISDWWHGGSGQGPRSSHMRVRY